MACQKCNSGRVLFVSGHCCDAFDANIRGQKYNGYVPNDIGIGRYGDDISFAYCLDCGQIQGNFPLERSGIEPVPQGEEA